MNDPVTLRITEAATKLLDVISGATPDDDHAYFQLLMDTLEEFYADGYDDGQRDATK